MGYAGSDAGAAVFRGIPGKGLAMATVLFASNDAELHALFEAEISGEGHEVVWAVDGQEACELALDRSPDMAFLDMRLDVFSGPEACNMLREDPEVPDAMPIYLLTDDDLDPHTIEKVRATGLFPKTHGAFALRELLARYAQ